GTQFFSIAKTEKITGSFQVNTASGDYLVSENNINLNPSAFTISAWIQNGNATGIRTIIAKGTDYEVRLNAAKVEVLWNGSSRITSTASVTDNKWHQIAVTFATGTAHLFIDGILDQTIASLPNPPSPTTAKFSIAARFNNKFTSTPFEGNIDEIRIWDSALTVNQLRYMMNQEIEKFTDDTVNGTILPQTITRNEVKTIPWANLKTYFNLNSIYGTAVEDQSNQRNFARIKYLSANKQIVNTQTAPLPYETSATGNWETAATWKNGGIQTLPNSSNINWNIVNLKHNVSATIGHTVLGLMNDALTKLTVQASDSLRVTHYLKLNGVIDLVGESQLVQDQGSILDATSLGTIERDQQGTGDNFKYNYWGSPVNITGTHYSIAGVLKDGTDVNNLKTIDFGTAWIYADGAVTSPIKLSTYWMYKFTNKLANDYYGWEGVGKDGLLKVGEGFTLKGSNTNLTEQNYTFTGKPNNGDITLTINSGREYLVGNPYPSSLNAKQFIRDNISTAAGGNRTSNIIDGNLYFWDHFGGGTHYLKSYEGGYAVFNLSGGVKAIANNTLINNTGNSSLTIPQRFIPVAQGFFVKADVGGDIQFKNSQRVFKKEQALTSIFIRNSAPSKSNKITSEDDFPRIYLNFSSPDGLHRQLLVGFIANTTDGIDIGYDGILNESNTSDMYWKAANTNLVIQAVPTLDNNRVLPIDVKVATAGTIKINVDGLENVPTETEIFIKDNLTGVKHLINTNPFEVNLTAGTYSSRFEVVFKTQGTLTVEENDALEQLLNIYVNNQQNKIHISKNQSVEIKEMVVYNMIGQQITSIKKVINEQVVEVPFNVQTGVYLIKVITNQGIISKKIIKQ
ncbi:MAG: LamG-like jellyroll fold domain-containing protein, partial [Flavobacteriaceae bacterium]|nr:LamG-like jellyroll fold domain-containing protein [Flavobacteriaceae bacterium]